MTLYFRLIEVVCNERIALVNKNYASDERRKNARETIERCRSFYPAEFKNKLAEAESEMKKAAIEFKGSGVAQARLTEIRHIYKKTHESKI
jgi:hypothetical protein